MSDAIVQTQHLTKQYGEFAALRDCSLTVRRGCITGLLGPNGAGKTTLLRLLLGFLRPTSGTAQVGGYDCVTRSEQVRELTAYLPAETRLSRSLTGDEVLKYFCALRPGTLLTRARQIAERLELDTTRLVSRMSTGMRQKTALAVVLAMPTELLILDEPTANLDPTARRTVLALVREARSAGRTVLFSSHVLTEVEELCDTVAVLRAGELVHEQPLSELRNRYRIQLRCPIAPQIPDEWREQITVTTGGDGLRQFDTGLELQPLLGWLATLPADELRIEPVRLQAVYDRFHPPTC